MALTAIPWGCWKFGKLNAAAAPVCEMPGVKTSIRLFWESQTYRRPDESVAILRGRLRPANVLEVPMEAKVCCPTTLDAVGPFATGLANSRTRLCAASETAIRPSGKRATP